MDILNNEIVPRTVVTGIQPRDLKIYVRLALRWLWLVVLCSLIGGAGAWWVNTNTTPIYQASSKIMISEGRNAANANYGDILLSERVARTYAELMRRQLVIQQVFERLGLDPALAGSQIASISVTPIRDTQLVQLTVESPSPDLAAAVANSLPTVFLDELRATQLSRFAESKASLSSQLETLSRQVEETKLQLSELENPRTSVEELEYTRLNNALTQYQTSYANLLQSFEELRLTEAQSLDTIVLMDPASAPTNPVRPRVLTNTLLAAVMGALAALGIVFLVEYLDDRVQTPDDLRRIADLPVLGAIAKIPAGRGKAKRSGNLLSITQPRHPIVEAYRRLRTNLQFYNLDEGLRSLAITSAEGGEGKSVTAANLAVVMAQSGLSVVLVDADLRKPQLHHIFDLPRKPGLAEALIAGELNPALLQPAPGVANLRVLTCGDSVPNPAEVMGSHRMRDLAAHLETVADVVIYDTPPVLAVTDALVAGQLADGVLLVVNTLKTSAGAVHRAIEALTQVNRPPMGAVLNRLSGSGRSYYYYYQYYTYGYYEEAPKDKQQAKVKEAIESI